MPSIYDFVNHRLADAKEELRKLDPDYVDTIEKTVYVQEAGLSTPWELDVNSGPKQRLSTEWHRLLEGCYDLLMKASVFQAAADGLIHVSEGRVPSIEDGKQQFYHMESWFIHGYALFQGAQVVIRNTTDLYISDTNVRKEMVDHYLSELRQIIKVFGDNRHEFAHGGTRSWGRVMTDNNLWEDSVAAGLTAQKAFNEHIYPMTAERAKSGTSRQMADIRTRTVLDVLVRLLHEFEEDIARENAVDARARDGVKE